MTEPKMTDRSIERIVSLILRSGVLISGTVVFAGGVLFLARHGHERVDYHTFRALPRSDRFVHEILAGAVGLRARSIIQLGVLLLLATPFARVAFSIVGFALERDKLYAIVTSIV
ncbi:MAG TPA: DUF1634 domain-containing protein, partial [Chthoniobacterales bacterium]|nr:DUF1634 domain-containing protein [Chthoniobacterales bacterium]